MKSKKIIAGITSAVMALTVSAASLTACDKGCEHVYTWNVTTPSTCTTEGSQDGLCGICGDVITQAIPIDENAHGYGKWDVNPVPTETAEGKATKTCSYNSSHKLEATLPALTDKGYTVVSETLPTATKEGETVYSYPNDAGAIEFTVKLPVRNVESVADAVEVGVSNVDQIVKVAGSSSLDSLSYSAEKFYYEFGENYTHIISVADGYEYYCLDDEEDDFFAVQITGVEYTFDSNGYPVNKTSQGTTPVRNVGLEPQYINGMNFSLGYTGTPTFYGAESLVSDLYDLAQTNADKDVYKSEQCTLNSDGTVSCEFTLSYFSTGGYRLSIITVEFSLTDTLAISEVKVTSDIYGNMLDSSGNEVDGTEEIFSGRYDDDGNKIMEIVPVKAWEYDEDKGIYRLKDGQEGNPSGRTSIELKQATETQLGIKREDLPENPYPRDFQYIESFNVKYNGKTLGEDDVVDLSSRRVYNFAITDVKNKGEGISNISLDPVTCYLRTPDEDIALDAGTKDNANIRVSAYVTGTTLTVNSMLTGVITIVIKSNSGSFEKELRVNVAAQAPTSIPPEVNVYNTQGVKGWRKPSGGEVITLYAGQPLEFRASLTADEESFCDPSFTAVIQQFEGRPFASSSAVASLTEPGSETMTFTGTTAGRYRIRLESALKSSVYSNLEVEVIAPPTVEELFGPTYQVQLQYPEQGKATAVFSSPTLTQNPAFKGMTYEGTVTITLNDISETLTYYYTEGGIDADTQQRLPSFIETLHKEGAEELGFSLSLNDGYFIVLTHATEFGSDETVVLERQENVE